MKNEKRAAICFECGRQGQSVQFRRDGKILNWCGSCIEKTAWDMQEPAYIKIQRDRDALLSTLKAMNHMGGDERGGYCICPLNNGSAPDQRHSSSCADARAAIAQAETD